RFGGLVLGLLVVGLATTGVSAPPSNTTKPGEEKGPPPPKDLDLKTDDGLALKATYYPGTKGEDTVPILILHDWKGDRSQFKELALFLQAKGRAVIVPDLRGHGGSTELIATGQAASKTITLKKPRKADMQAMVDQDVLEVNRFLRA